MTPTLFDGDVVFVDSRVRLIEEGEVVAAQHPTRPNLRIVKRVGFTDELGRLYLLSDNEDVADAADSRVFGPIDRELLIGLVKSRLTG